MKSAKKMHEQKRCQWAYMRQAMKGTIIKAGPTMSGKSTCRSVRPVAL